MNNIKNNLDFSNSHLQELLKGRGISPEQLSFVKPDELDWEELTLVAKEVMSDIFRGRYKNILVLYDPDVDGIFSGYILEDFLKRLGIPANKIFRFMNKNKKHGFSKEMVNYILENDIDYLFVVDAGSSDVQEFYKYIPEVKTIILDHHEYGEIVVPKESKIIRLNIHDYPHLPHLSGCGVVYRFIEQITKIYDLDLEITEYEVFVGMTVLSDVCTMLEPENRFYVSQSYKNVQMNEFLNAFYKKSFYGSYITLYSWYIVPYLNALIRIGAEDLAMKIANNMDSPMLSRFLEKSRLEVRAKQQDEIAKIEKMSEKHIADDFVVLLRKKGDELTTLNGLVANQQMSKYGKSTLVLVLSTDNEGNHFWQGSFRGSNFDNQELINNNFECHGHKKACGVSVGLKDLKSFVLNYKYEGESNPLIKEYDLEMSLEELNKEENLKAFAQFNEYASGDIAPVKIKITNPINRKTAVKRAVGASGKMYIIKTGSYEITDFSHDSLDDIDCLIVTVNYSTYNPYQIVRCV